MNKKFIRFKNKIRKILNRKLFFPFNARIRQYYFVRKYIDNLIIKKFESTIENEYIPHQIKQYWISYYQKQYSIKTLIETGTYKGNTIHAFVHQFNRIYSIELDRDLWHYCKIRFKKYKNIELICGDSGLKLPKLLDEISERSVFWLDGHYSGAGTARAKEDTPILKELIAIKSHKINNHII